VAGLAYITAFVTSTKLSYVEPGYYWDWWRHLAGLPSRYLSRPLRPTQPGHPSLGIVKNIVVMWSSYSLVHRRLYTVFERESWSLLSDWYEMGAGFSGTLSNLAFMWCCRRWRYNSGLNRRSGKAALQSASSKLYKHRRQYSKMNIYCVKWKSRSKLLIKIKKNSPLHYFIQRRRQHPDPELHHSFFRRQRLRSGLQLASVMRSINCRNGAAR